MTSAEDVACSSSELPSRDLNSYLFAYKIINLNDYYCDLIVDDASNGLGIVLTKYECNC